MVISVLLCSLLLDR